ncbi:COX15/CtaA family protein [Guyparkeria halophila]|uniref:COX15/CtaA family protein n=1 Tax=Guyparkeria halophila TaxID=47960 RepID=A0ABZ0YU27_9GAMM|nr:COX15/CtaA family protein [Guyparkeria halophila]WQH15675.1 COX15/CtaA family protein [Guyparkeria halophila]
MVHLSAKQRKTTPGDGRTYRRLTYLATILALVVVVLGAYVRLTDAGLGCPDWPGCYGHLTVSSAQANESQVNAMYPDQPLEAGKALNEMVHRYAAGTLGLLILMLVGIGWWYKRHRAILSTLAGLVVFQALLGMWTVTMLLKPLVVTAHLLGGMTVLSMLWWIWLDNRHRWLRQAGAEPSPPSTVTSGMRWFAAVGLVLLIVQIFLGGWTSTNYAGLACSGFPTCNGQWWPDADYSNVFGLHEVNDLHGAGLIAIQWLHRLGALAVFITLLALAIKASPIAPRLALAIGILLGAQIAIGVGNVLFGLPLPLADAHNAVAALLLLAVIALNHHLNYPLTPSTGQASKGVLT